MALGLVLVFDSAIVIWITPPPNKWLISATNHPIRCFPTFYCRPRVKQISKMQLHWVATRAFGYTVHDGYFTQTVDVVIT